MTYRRWFYAPEIFKCEPPPRQETGKMSSSTNRDQNSPKRNLPKQQCTALKQHSQPKTAKPQDRPGTLCGHECLCVLSLTRGNGTPSFPHHPQTICSFDPFLDQLKPHITIYNQKPLFSKLYFRKQ